ncbi:hypothetical protein H8S90_09690 [Olivibacter sp. SDN3]|uniref:hypothetical protein n=1 Tax=Olivibacter sp. SDN3 TaxID=2764720 RepID=UPI0016510555|nr:hypothetical protein [Olivibacter sp. SDN3]QNL51818.1 hypothetical protein H8S90_09690 [Olivibacter sp. SDN3]
MNELEVFILSDGFIRDKNIDRYSPSADLSALKVLLKANFRSDEYVDMAMNVPLVRTKDKLVPIG